jgi:hypothetical protein
MAKIISFLFGYIFFPFIIFGCLPIGLGISGGKALAGIFIGIVLFFAYIGYLVRGCFVGAAYTLASPPQRGNVNVEAPLLGRAVWESKTIIFETLRKRSVVHWRHKRIWLSIREDFEHGLSLKVIITKHRLKITDETLRTIIEEGTSGELD